MSLKEFIENLASAYDDVSTSELAPNTKFKELNEWSSLTALSVIAMVNEEYDVELSGKDIRDAKTVEDLFNIVQSRK